MLPKKEILDSMAIKGFTFWFIPSPGKLVFINPNDLNDEKVRRIRKEYDVDVTKTRNGLIAYNLDEYIIDRSRIASRTNRLTVRTLPWFENPELGSVSLGGAVALDLTNWAGTFPGSVIFSVTQKEIVIGEDCIMPEDCSSLFSRCYAEKISINCAFKPTKASAMFQWCHNLKEVNLPLADFSCVTDATGMFGGCESLASVDLSSMNPKAIFSTKSSTSGAFYNCNSLPFGYSELAARNGEMQDLCKYLYGHPFITLLYGSPTCAIYRTNQDDTKMQQMAERVGMQFHRFGMQVLLHKDNNLSLGDREAIRTFINQKDWKSLFPGLPETEDTEFSLSKMQAF